MKSDPCGNLDMLGALRAGRMILDGRIRFTKKLKLTPTRKRNDRKRIKILMENSLILREGREAFVKLNARLAAEGQKLK